MATLGKWPSALNCGIRFVRARTLLTHLTSALCLSLSPWCLLLFLLFHWIRVCACLYEERSVCCGQVFNWSSGSLSKSTDRLQITQRHRGFNCVYSYGNTMMKHSPTCISCSTHILPVVCECGCERVMCCMCKQTSVTMSQPTSETSINLVSLINLVPFQSPCPVTRLSHCRHIRLWQRERPNWSAPLFFTGVTGKMGQSKTRPEGWIWSKSLLAFKMEPVIQKCIVLSSLINSGVKLIGYINKMIKYSMHNPPFIY